MSLTKAMDSNQSTEYDSTSPIVDIFGSKGKVRILDSLVQSTGESKNPQELAEMADLNPSTVYRNLPDLVKMGIVVELPKQDSSDEYIINTNSEVTNLLISIRGDTSKHQEPKSAVSGLEGKLQPPIQDEEETDLFSCYFAGVSQEFGRSPVTQKLYEAIKHFDSSVFTKSIIAEETGSEVHSLSANHTFDRLKRWGVIFGVPKLSRRDHENLARYDPVINFIDHPFQSFWKRDKANRAIKYLSNRICDDDFVPTLWNQESVIDSKEAVVFAEVSEYSNIEQPEVTFDWFGHVENQVWDLRGYRIKGRISGSILEVNQEQYLISELRRILYEMTRVGCMNEIEMLENEGFKDIYKQDSIIDDDFVECNIEINSSDNVITFNFELKPPVSNE